MSCVLIIDYAYLTRALTNTIFSKIPQSVSHATAQKRDDVTITIIDVIAISTSIRHGTAVRVVVTIDCEQCIDTMTNTRNFT